MQDREIETIEYNGREYAIVEEKDNVLYTVDFEDKKTVKLFKSSVINNEEYIEELDEVSSSIAFKKFIDNNC